MSRNILEHRAPTSRHSAAALYPRFARNDASLLRGARPNQSTTPREHLDRDASSGTGETAAVKRAPVSITTEYVLTGEAAERLSEMHLANFAALKTVAIQSQTASREELLELFANPKFVKVVAWKNGVPVGLGVMTNHLEEVPEISHEFLQMRYPEQAARNAIFWGIYVTVDANHRGVTLFSRLTTAMGQLTARSGGVFIYDMCEYNRQVGRVDALATQMSRLFPNSKVSIVDTQTWYVAELPEPIAGR
jgi:hypothetical protein